MRSHIVAAILLFSAGTSGAAQIEQGVRNRAMQPYRVGLEHMRAEDWPKAIAAFQAAIEIDPTFEIAFYTLGRSHMGEKEYGLAVSAFTRCRDLYLTDSGKRFSNSQEAQRYRRDRILEIDEIIRQYQSGAQTMRTQEILRQLTERRRQLQQTIDRGTNITIENSVPAFVSLSLGSAYFRSGNLADAEKAYLDAVAADPKAGEAYSNLAVVYMETGRYTEADRSVEAAEKVGFRVAPALKQEIQKRKRGT